MSTNNQKSRADKDAPYAATEIAAELRSAIAALKAHGIHSIAPGHNVHLLERAAAELDGVPDQRRATDKAYRERDMCLALLAALAHRAGYHVGLGRHEGVDWEADWRHILYIDLIHGQVSWHIHDSEYPWFAYLPRYERTWDGHDTDEKYRRVLAEVFGHGG